MRLDWWTVGLQIVNFAILAWLLHRFLYRPVLRVIDARKADVQRQFDRAKAAEDSAKARLAEIERERAAIAAERAAALSTAAGQAKEAADAQRAQARREADAILKAARKTLADEREQALVEARRAALDLGAEFARRLFAEIPAQLRAEAWLDGIERHLQSLPKADVEALSRQFASGATLTVVTPSPLPPEIADSWRARICRALNDDVAITFKTKPDLVLGAELHCPNAVLSFSWQSMLDSARSELDGRDDAR